MPIGTFLRFELRHFGLAYGEDTPVEVFRVPFGDLTGVESVHGFGRQLDRGAMYR